MLRTDTHHVPPPRGRFEAAVYAAADARGLREGPNLLRALGAFGICWYHLLTTFWFSTPDGDFYHFLRTTVRYLWPSIPFFLVISGFGVPTALYRKGYTLGSYPAYMLKRLVRLEPPYLVAIGLILLSSFAYACATGRPFLVEGEPVTWTRVLLHLGYLNAFTGHKWLSLPFWMLAVEFQYYVVMGLAFPLFGTTRRKLRIASFVVTAVFCLLVTDRATPGKVVLSQLFTSYTFLFLLGVLTFQFTERLSGRREFLTLLALALLGSWWTVGSAAAVSGGLTVAATLFYKRKSRVVTFLSNISYPFYLLHWFVCPVLLSLASSRLTVTHTDAGKALALFGSMFVCACVAWVLHVSVEEPARDWSARVRYGKTKRERVAPAVAAEPLVDGSTA